MTQLFNICSLDFVNSMWNEQTNLRKQSIIGWKLKVILSTTILSQQTHLIHSMKNNFYFTINKRVTTTHKGQSNINLPLTDCQTKLIINQ